MMIALGGHSDRVVQSVLYQMVEDVGDVMNRLHKDVVVHLTRAGKIDCAIQEGP